MAVPATRPARSVGAVTASAGRAAGSTSRVVIEPSAKATEAAVPTATGAVAKYAGTLPTLALAAAGSSRVLRYAAPPPPATRRTIPARRAILVLLVI